MKNNDKTNVMRLLDSKKIPYTPHLFDADGSMSGTDIARLQGEDPGKVYKTLVTQGKTGRYYVFVVPVEAELDLKKAAKAAGEKAIRMIPQKELLPLTGYVHGGCSPIGMKKPFPTFIDQSAMPLETIYVSAGRIGAQIELTPDDLIRAANATFADVA